jgi:hypothetical protein
VALWNLDLFPQTRAKFAECPALVVEDAESLLRESKYVVGERQKDPSRWPEQRYSYLWTFTCAMRDDERFPRASDRIGSQSSMARYVTFTHPRDYDCNRYELFSTLNALVYRMARLSVHTKFVGPPPTEPFTTVPVTSLEMTHKNPVVPWFAATSPAILMDGMISCSAFADCPYPREEDKGGSCARDWERAIEVYGADEVERWQMNHSQCPGEQDKAAGESWREWRRRALEAHRVEGFAGWQMT